MTAVVLVVLGAGCAGAERAERPTTEAAEPRTERSTAAPRTTTPAPRPVPEPAPEPRIEVSDGRPRDAVLTIPELGLRRLPVIAYRGFTDDAPGTQIQNEGRAASPFGPHSGVGPGGIGNYQITAHRTSSTRAFEFLPGLRKGDLVHVVSGARRYTYRITDTRETSFRSERSLREQRAAVPGHPGRRPTRAMITLSTCATQEDHAAGNYWADEFDNPEHRIDKIGVLVASRDAR